MPNAVCTAEARRWPRKDSPGLASCVVSRGEVGGPIAIAGTPQRRPRLRPRRADAVRARVKAIKEAALCKHAHATANRSRLDHGQ